MKKTNKRNDVVEILLFPCILASKNIKQDYEKIKKPLNNGEDTEKFSYVIDEILNISNYPHLYAFIFSRLYPIEDFLDRNLTDILFDYSFNLKEDLKIAAPKVRLISIFSSDGRLRYGLDPKFKKFNFNKFEKGDDILNLLYFTIPVVLSGNENNIDKIIEKFSDIKKFHLEVLEYIMEENLKLNGCLTILPPCFEDEIVDKINEFMEEHESEEDEETS